MTFRAPAAWVRGSTVPSCAASWPSAIGLVWLATRRARGPLEALRTFAGARWLGWDLVPFEWREEAERVATDAADVGAVGVVLVPEREWLGKDEEDARALVAFFRERGLKVAIASYGLPSRSFPLAGFSGAGTAIAETYDRDATASPTYLARATAIYTAAGFDQVVPSVGLWNHRAGRYKSESELRLHLSQRPKASVVWGPSTWSARACAALERWQAGGAPSGGGGGGGVGAGLLLAGIAALGAWWASRA